MPAKGRGRPEQGQGRRAVEFAFPGDQVTDGAGVRLRRSLGSRVVESVDPFLLFDEFKSRNPDDYVAGFPWHPHRGMETVTYMIDGSVRHGDSLGNGGTIGPGWIQWMTAGRGIIHQEMPERQEGRLWGFQLWVNLPRKLKLREPRYQDIPPDRIPVAERSGDVTVRVMAGEVDGARGPVSGIDVAPTYLDVSVPQGAAFREELPVGHNVVAWVAEGEGEFGRPVDPSIPERLGSPQLVVFGEGDHVEVHAPHGPVRFLLMAARPLNEPVARGGPFVMNTPDEIRQAFEEYRNGTLLEPRG